MSDPIAIPDLAVPGDPADGFWEIMAQTQRHSADFRVNLRSQYDIDDRLLNLENGFWGVMSEPVRAAYTAWVHRVNRENSAYVRAGFADDAEQVRQQVAKAVGAGADEIVLTRGATESLKLLIANYNGLSPGDAVLIADLDYPAMIHAMEWLQERRGVRLVRISLPEPGSAADLLAAYEAALTANPDVRLMMLTHLSHLTGLVTPAKDIIAMARQRGVDVILDAAHSWGQMDFTVDDLGVDFAGFNLHKWIGAPLGVGFTYIRRHRLVAIDPDLGDRDFPRSDIRSRCHTGSINFATVLTVPTALARHQAIGAGFKQVRLCALRDHWVRQVRGDSRITILTPDEPGSYAGITSLRLNGITDTAGNQAIVARLRDQYGILTVWRAGAAGGACVRITPALFTTEAELDRFVMALRDIAGQMSA